MKKLGNVFLLGDSYSTFEDWIPDGFWTWYFKDQRTGTDVKSVKETWWYQLLDETDSNLILNCSYSGTTICNKGKDGVDCSKISFVGRFDRLIQDGFFNGKEINTLLIFGGTNDSWLDSPIGFLKYENWQQSDLDASIPAFCYLLQRVKEVCKTARIIYILNTGIKTELMDGYISACRHYSVDCIQLNNIDKIKGHPSVHGMQQIKEQVISFI